MAATLTASAFSCQVSGIAVLVSCNKANWYAEHTVSFLAVP